MKVGKISLHFRLNVFTTSFIIKLFGKWGWLEIGILTKNWSYWAKLTGFLKYSGEYTKYESLGPIERNRWGFPMKNSRSPKA